MKESKAYVIGKMKEAGLEVRMDQVGNIFGRRRGKETDNGILMSGSHLDSVINGGYYLNDVYLADCLTFVFLWSCFTIIQVGKCAFPLDA